MTTFSDFPSKAMLRIKEVEMVDSLEEFESSQSIDGQHFPIIEMLDAKIASALNKIMQNSPGRRPVSRNRKPRKRINFLAEDRSLTRSTTTFESTGAHEPFLIMPDLFSITLRQRMMSKTSIRGVTKILLSMSKIPSDDVLESL